MEFPLTYIIKYTHQIKYPHQRLDEMSQLVSKLTAKDKIVLMRDEKFYSRRDKNPLSSYLFAYWHDKTLKGFQVAQTSFYEYDSMLHYNIIEFEAASASIKMDLLNTLTSIFGKRIISIWSNMLEDDVRRFSESKRFRQ